MINIGIAIAAPLFFRYGFSLIENARDSQPSARQVLFAALAYGVFNFVSWFIRVIQFTFVTKLNARVIRDIRVDAFSFVLKNQVSFFDQNESGRLTSRIINDSQELFDTATSISYTLTGIFRLLVTLSVMFYFSPVLTLSILPFMALVFIIARLLRGFQRRVSDAWRKKFAEVNQRFAETMRAIQVSKAFGRESENLKQFGELNEATFRASIYRGIGIFVFWPITDLFEQLLLLLVLGVGTWLIGSGLSISTVYLFILLLPFYYWPMLTIARNYHKFQGAFANLERILHLIDDLDSKEVEVGISAPYPIQCSIEFDHVTFGYNPETPVLHNLCFSVSPGQRIALVGHTGAGKTTIASLLLRFYTPQNGEIRLGGTNIQEYNLHYLRKMIGYVSQRVLLFRGTLRENLLLANPLASDEEIWKALEAVQAREFVELLPCGLDTVVEEYGKNLSAGQRQMISFARVILSNPQMILLDEATSAVDLYTESKIQKAVDRILRGKTSIVIAHRLTTILRSDLIIVLEDGSIRQIGSHADLINQSGPYRELYDLYFQTQSAKYLERIKVRS